MKENTTTALSAVKLSEIDTLIWDWNGTLLDDVDVNVKIINELISKRFLKKLDHNAYKEVFCFPVRNFYQRIGFDLEKETIEEISVEYHAGFKQYGKKACLNMDTLFVLDALNKRGINQFILSAADKNDLAKMLSDFELTGKFNKIYGSENIYGIGKIGIGKLLIEENEIDPARALMVGDTLHDAEVARELGVHYLLYSGGHNSHSILKKEAKVITSLKDLLSL